MILTAAVKVFSDLCLYFAAISITVPRFYPGTTLLFLGALCSVGVALATLSHRHPVFRFLGILPPLAGLLLSSHPQDLPFLLPAALYTLFTIIRGHFVPDRDSFHTFFFRSLPVLAVAFMLTLLGNWRGLLFYGALYILCGFFLLRQLRLGSDHNWQSSALNLITLLATLAGGGLICLGIYGVMQLRYPFAEVITRLVEILVYILYPLSLLLQKLLLLLRARAQDLPAMDGTLTEDAPYFEYTPTDPVAQVVITLVIVLAVAAACLWVLRLLLKGMKRSRIEGPRQTREERITQASAQRRPLFSGGNREKVRRTYRKFLQLLASRGVDLAPSLTTLEIQDLAAPDTAEIPAQQLRELYLTARYDEQRQVTDQDVQQAKTLLRTLNREKKS